MKIAKFRFYEELNDFLPSKRRKISLDHEFSGSPSVKDSIEALGVPHVEVDLVVVNGMSVDFKYHLKDGDNVSVYPVFESLDITPLIRLREKPLRVTKFILDSHLGWLAKYMRICGFDTLFDNNYSDPEIVGIAESEKRIILTRDRELLKNNRVTHGYWIRSVKNDNQLKEVLRRFDLYRQVSLFTRCLKCNTVLEEVNKEEIEDKLKPGTRKHFSTFKRCPVCKRIYWNGTHYDRMKKFVESFL